MATPTSDTDRNTLIRQVRLMMCRGCTPLHVIKHLYEQCAEAKRWQAFVTDCFQQAFSVILLTLPDRYDTLLENREIQDYLNTEVLHEILSNRHLWTSNDMQHGIADSWLNELHPIDVWTATDAFDPQTIPEIALIWPHLDDAARQYFRLLIVNSKANYERSLILGRLVETLQERLVSCVSKDKAGS